MTTFRQLVDKCRDYKPQGVVIPAGGLDLYTGLAYSFVKWDEICSGERPLREAGDSCGFCWIGQSCPECPLSATAVAGRSYQDNSPTGCGRGSHWNWITRHVHDSNITVVKTVRKKCKEMRDAIKGLCPEDWDKELGPVK